MADWRDEYRRKLISAEEAARFVKSGSTVKFTMGREAWSVGLAIAARKDELKGVKVYIAVPGYDFGWYDPGWEDSFALTVGWTNPLCRQAVDERRVDFDYFFMNPQLEQPVDFRNPDLLLTEVSTPDDKGFCSFGASVWAKRREIREARLVVAEVNQNLIRTYGDNFIHISEIDHFVEHVSKGGAPGMGSLTGQEVKEPEPYLKDIAGYLSPLIKDGDTLQIGVGRTTEPMVRLGLLDNKHDIGVHSEATSPGSIRLVREGVITGRYKTVNPGKVVVCSIGGDTRKEMDWVNMNPIFHVMDAEYVQDIRVIAAHDNMVAINNALAIDLTGQVTAEGLGTRILSTAGGRIVFVVGALLSKGGRSITVLPSTAQGETASRVVPVLPAGTPVTVQKQCADYVVTEFGVVNLRGKTMRQRAEEIISVAHPDFRAELRKEAARLFWPS